MKSEQVFFMTIQLGQKVNIMDFLKSNVHKRNWYDIHYLYRIKDGEQESKKQPRDSMIEF